MTPLRSSDLARCLVLSPANDIPTKIQGGYRTWRDPIHGNLDPLHAEQRDAITFMTPTTVTGSLMIDTKSSEQNLPPNRPHFRAISISFGAQSQRP